MNYLQRFSRALTALTGQEGDDHARRIARRRARTEAGDWLGQLHDVARRLPPRGRTKRKPPSRD